MEAISVSKISGVTKANNTNNGGCHDENICEILTENVAVRAQQFDRRGVTKSELTRLLLSYNGQLPCTKMQCIREKELLIKQIKMKDEVISKLSLMIQKMQRILVEIGCEVKGRFPKSKAGDCFNELENFFIQPPNNASEAVDDIPPSICPLSSFKSKDLPRKSIHISNRIRDSRIKPSASLRTLPVTSRKPILSFKPSPVVMPSVPPVPSVPPIPSASVIPSVPLIPSVTSIAPASTAPRSLMFATNIDKNLAPFAPIPARYLRIADTKIVEESKTKKKISIIGGMNLKKNISKDVIELSDDDQERVNGEMKDNRSSNKSLLRLNEAGGSRHFSIEEACTIEIPFFSRSSKRFQRMHRLNTPCINSVPALPSLRISWKNSVLDVLTNKRIFLEVSYGASNAFKFNIYYYIQAVVESDYKMDWVFAHSGICGASGKSLLIFRFNENQVLAVDDSLYFTGYLESYIGKCSIFSEITTIDLNTSLK